MVSDSSSLLLMSFLFLPVHFNFMHGQVDIFVLLAYVLSFDLLRSKDRRGLAWRSLSACGNFTWSFLLATIMLMRAKGAFGPDSPRAVRGP